MDYMSSRKMSGVSFCSGVLAGLVTITPGSGFVSPWASVIFGIVGAASCNLAVRAKEHLGYDDQLDAFGLHGVGGMVGAILTGIFHQGFITTLDGGSSNGGAIEGTSSLDI
jgi:Amt family ammonium transporter